MASSNVEYYQKQKDLQDAMQEYENRRKQLEAQLQAYSRSDEKMAKLRGVKLQSYWKKICEEERRSKQRNAQILRDLDRMQSNLDNLSERRERLRFLKQQYWDYIDKTYPQWKELVQQRQQEKQFQQQEEFNQQLQQQQQYQQQQQQLQQQQQQLLQQQQQLEQQRVRQEEQQQFHQHLRQRQHQAAEEEDDPPPLPSQPPPPPSPFASRQSGHGDQPTIPEREYTNLKGISRESPSSQQTNKSQPVPTGTSSVTVRMPSTSQVEATPVGTAGHQTGQNWLAAERDASVHSISFSEEVEVPISQPVQSVTVRQRQTEQAVIRPSPMQTGSDDDVSDFGDDISLPGDEAPPLPKSPPPASPAYVTAVTADVHAEDDEEEDSTSPIVPELTQTGLQRLLKYVEDDLERSLSVEGYYRSHSPDTNTRARIIQQANSQSVSLGMDAEQISMVILEQLTPIIRDLPGKCILPESLLIQHLDKFTTMQVRYYMQKDAQGLWDRLIRHFLLLVKYHAMGSREVAYVFVPCLVHDSSRHQEKAVTLIERLVEQQTPTRLDDERQSPMPTDSQMDTARSSSLQGGAIVPPLKFGSLVDKPFSDEESSMFSQSIPTEGPKVPLNETEAYKSLLSGSMGANRVKHVVSGDTDTDDNSDNDLEKQFVSTLSPRSHASKPPVPHGQPSSTPPPVQQPKSHDQSGDPRSADVETGSEVSSALASPVYVPTGVESRPKSSAKPSTVKSNLGSTGGSSQQKKLAGMISSDLDTDTEVDIRRMTRKKSEAEDDDFDFYG